MKSASERLGLCLTFGFLVASAAHAVTVPFTEDFSADTAKWKNSASLDLSFVAAGGPDGGSFVSSDQVFAGQPLASGLILFRGQDFFDSSNDAFVGNWLTSGVGQLTAYVHHNASEPLSFIARFATSTNFPGVDVELPTKVAPNTWTKLVFDINPANPLLTVEGPPSLYTATFSNLGNVQIGVYDLAGFTNDATTYTFGLDKVSIGVPEPASIGLLSIGLVCGLIWRLRRVR